MVKELILALLLAGASATAQAQTQVQTFQGGMQNCVTGAATCNDRSGTIAVTNTFQSLWVAASGRKGCLIQNTSGHVQYIYIGPIAGATLAKSFQVLPNGWFSCRGGGMVLTDQISITGTTTDTFVAKSN